MLSEYRASLTIIGLIYDFKGSVRSKSLQSGYSIIYQAVVHDDHMVRLDLSLGENLTVNHERLFRCLLPRKLLRALPAELRASRRKFAVCQKPIGGVCDRSSTPWVHGDPRSSGYLLTGGAAADNHGAAACHGLEYAQAESFIERRKNKRAGCTIKKRKILFRNISQSSNGTGVRILHSHGYGPIQITPDQNQLKITETRSCIPDHVESCDDPIYVPTRMDVTDKQEEIASQAVSLSQTFQLLLVTDPSVPAPINAIGDQYDRFRGKAITANYLTS